MNLFTTQSKKLITGLMVLSTLLTGCSRLEFVLDYAPRYVANSLEDSLDLSSERYRKIKAALEKDIAENKKPLLSEVIGYIEGLEQLTAEAGPLTKADMEKNFRKIKDFQQRAVAQFRPSFTEVILGISEKELEHLKKYTAKKFEKADERILDRDDFFKHSFKSFERTMEILFESVTDAQKQIYRDFVAANYEYYKSQIAARKNFMTQFELRLPRKEEMLEYTMKYYAGDDSIKTPEHLKLQAVFFDNLNQLQVDIWNSTTPEQKEEFRNTLARIKEELNGLIK